MFNSIKLWLYGAAAALFALLLGWVKIIKSQRNAAVAEAEKQAQARMAEAAKHKQQTDVHEARVKASEEAKQIKPSDTRGKRPVGNFGDKRL